MIIVIMRMLFLLPCLIETVVRGDSHNRRGSDWALVAPEVVKHEPVHEVRVLKSGEIEAEAGAVSSLEGVDVVECEVGRRIELRDCACLQVD